VGNVGETVVNSVAKDAHFVRELLKASPQVIYVYDRVNHELVYASDNLLALTGYDGGAVNSTIGSFWTLVHPDDAQLVADHLERLMSAEDGVEVSSTFRALHSMGHYVWVNTVERVFERKPDGTVSLTAGYASDVTSSVLAQRELERKAKANAFLLQSSLILSDLENDLADTAQRLMEYVSLHLGVVAEVSVVYPPSSLVHPLAVYHPDQEVLASIKRAFKSAQVKVGEGYVGGVLANGVEVLCMKADDVLREQIGRYDPLLVPECFIYCPLITKRGILGVLNVTRLNQSSTFTEEELGQVRKLAGHLALYLENARLREGQMAELELRRKSQMELHYANKVNLFLLEVSRVLLDIEVGHEETLKRLSSIISSHFNVFCIIYLKDVESGKLHQRAYHHQDASVMSALAEVFERHGLENGLRAASHAMRSGKPFVVNDVDSQTMFTAEMDSRLMPQAYGFWPLKGSESFGAICLSRPANETPFSDDELKRAEQLAAHMSIFLENILLAERQRLEIERRTLAEHKLARGEAELRMILNAIPINISRVSKDLHYRFLNDAYRRADMDPVLLEGRHLREVLGEDTLGELMPKIDRVLAGETLAFDESIRLKGGGLKHVSVVMAPDVDEVGQVQGFYSCSIDVTDKVEAQQHLRLSEERYRSLLLNSGDAFCLHKATGEILDVNSFATTLLGYERDELIGMDISDIDPGWHTPEYPRRLDKVEPDTPITFDTELIHKDGTRIAVEVRFVKRIEYGTVLVQALVRDRREKHIQQEKLRKSEEWLRFLVENVNDTIVGLDWDGTILSINRTHQGHLQSDVIGSSIFHNMEEEAKQQLKQHMAEARATGKPFEMLMRHHGMDGTFEWYLARYCPVERGEMLVCVSRNITYIKDSELQVMNGMTLGQEQERKRLGAELHDGVGQILSSIALELSQLRGRPMAGDAMLERLDDLGSRVKEAIKEVRNISHDLTPGVLENFGLSEAIREVCKNMQERSGISFRFDPIDLDSSYTSTIETHVYRIAQELVTNCVRHAHCAKVHINLIDDGTYLSLTVEDDGIGFDTKAQSYGIGLGNIASRVSILRGSLTVESSRTSGTLVHIEIPKE
jgi:PAS domain S-box-containing protein